ncbi:MAG TPA: maltodextrin glucosidase [Kofleriaceae bacterium]|nr:maltodextrin glucosidase [Kofleriaceae bacterium]
MTDRPSFAVRLLHPPIAPWRIRTAHGCQVSLFVDPCDAPPRAVYVRADPDNEEHLIRMQPTATGFTAELAWDPGNTTTHYAFKVVFDHHQVWLAADGTHAYTPARDVMFKVCRDHQPPPWIADQIAYQIFPDRFCQGDPSHAVRTDEYVRDTGHVRVVQAAWGAPIDRALPATSFYGGDLAGIEAQLAYLHDELGVTLLYLNPIFTSGSNHKYDTEDYANVDPHLGGNAALARLAAAVHARGMRLVLDAVVNHTGSNHPWFNRFGRHATLGAYQSPDSPWRHWYLFKGPHDYVSWKGHDTLPVLDFSNPEVCHEVYAGEDAIVRRWMRPPYAIDGWRFDVIHMLGEGEGAHNNPHHVRAMRRAMREENAEAYLLGEHFAEATRWLQGDQEDGAMNYHGFAIPVRAWLSGRDIADHPARLSTADFARWLADAMARIPYDNQLAQLNLLDSHDTSRFLTAVGGDAGRLALAATLMFTFPGVPCVYYGDEIGLEGGGDPDCRRCFDWDRAHWHAELHAHYRQLIAWRKQRAEWRRGAFAILHTAEHAIVLARFVADAATIVIVHRGDAPLAITLGAAPLPIAMAWADPDGAPVDLAAAVHVAPRAARVIFGAAPAPPPGPDRSCAR